MIIKVKPQAKKARIDEGSVKEPADIAKAPDFDTEKSPDIVRSSNGDDTHKSNDVTKTGLVSYSDESDSDDD